MNIQTHIHFSAEYEYKWDNPYSLMRGLATLLQGNQESLMVKVKVGGRSPGELGVSKSVECDTFPFSAQTLVGWATRRASGQ